MVTDFRKVRIGRITFGRPRSSTQNYLRAGAAPDPCSSSQIEGGWSMEPPCDDLASNGGLKFEIRWVLMSVWSFSFLAEKSFGSSQIKLRQFLFQWICNEPLIITGVSDLHENGLRIQFTDPNMSTGVFVRARLLSLTSWVIKWCQIELKLIFLDVECSEDCHGTLRSP